MKFTLEFDPSMIKLKMIISFLNSTIFKEVDIVESLASDIQKLLQADQCH